MGMVFRTWAHERASFFDPQLRWDIHINHVCKRMSYYLYLISYHRRQLPLQILKMLMDTLVLSQFYALPVWGPSLGTAAVSRLIAAPL